MDDVLAVSLVMDGFLDENNVFKPSYLHAISNKNGDAFFDGRVMLKEEAIDLNIRS